MGTTEKKGGGDEYASFSDISSGDILSVSSRAIQSEFGEKTWVTITDSDGDKICNKGKIKACKSSIVAQEVIDCDALIVISFTSGDGALCDVDAISLIDDSSSNDNALVTNNGEGVKHGPFKAFSELDP